MPISKMTVAALEDIGYIINPSMVSESTDNMDVLSTSGTPELSGIFPVTLSIIVSLGESACLLPSVPRSVPSLPRTEKRKRESKQKRHHHYICANCLTRVPPAAPTSSLIFSPVWGTPPPFFRCQLCLIADPSHLVFEHRYKQVDEYVLPKLRPQFMRVYDDAHQAPFELNEALTPFPVVVTQEGTGEVVEVLNGVGMRF